MLNSLSVRHSSGCKTSGSDGKVNRNIYPDAVTRGRMRCLLEESQGEKELFLSTQDWVLSLDVDRFQNT